MSNIISKRHVTTATLLAFMVTAQAQITQTPKLIVNITVDQLTTENLQTYMPQLSQNGLKRLIEKGTVYQDVSYPFQPVDKASALTTIVTGTTPYYNGIIGNTWFNRKTGKLQGCTDDSDMQGIYTTDKASARQILTSTLGDELKLSTKGQSIVFGISEDKTAAILTAGHAGNGAIWKDRYNGGWCSSSYYFRTAPSWLTA
ncbi:MAG: alkaline phosphatase family protein, partial [Prevotella sp.]|nr:alkaline phosphatase family protein [Prevotella sp.]